MYKTKWKKFLSSGFVLIAILLAVISCMQQESVKDSSDQKADTKELNADTKKENEPDSTAITN